MRLERLRAYTAASGPLTSGASTGPTGRSTSAATPSPTPATLLAINWRAPAAEPFYAATPTDPRGVSAPAAAGHRGPHGARLRRRGARRRRRRAPDRRHRGRHHRPAGGRDAADHLDDHAGAVRAHQRAGAGRARRPGRPGHGQDGRRPAPRGLAVVRRPRARPRRRARRRPQPHVHRLHLPGAARARRAERRAAADRRARAERRWAGTERRSAPAARQRPHGRGARAAAVDARRPAAGSPRCSRSPGPRCAPSRTRSPRCSPRHALSGARTRPGASASGSGSPGGWPRMLIARSRLAAGATRRPSSARCGARASTRSWPTAAGRGTRPRRSCARSSASAGGSTAAAGLLSERGDRPAACVRATRPPRAR